MKKFLLSVLSILLGSVVSLAQDKGQKDLKIGLVLSGGGAKGLAHIGVLKAIEEAGLRIDYIGGTSMGAIIGAMYASGYSSNELDSIFRSVDFQKLIQDEVPRSAKTFYEKNNSERYALTVPFDRFKISVPSAISKGQNVYNLYSQLLFHVRDVDDFNKLPIPYFCIATNIETGEEVILDEGYLPRAIAASGALPSVFEPVEINGKVLIDGGVVNNYPIDEVRAKGMDVIIGVDVQDDLADRESLKAANEILMQISNYRTALVMKEKIKKTDVYIKPDITDFNVLSFDQGTQIYKRGYYAAKEQSSLLDSLAALQKKERYIQSVIRPYRRDTLSLSTIDIKGYDRYSRAYIRGKLRFKKDELITFEKFNEGISNLSATNNFKGIQYELKHDAETGKENLIMEVEETPASLFLRLGVHYDGLYKSAVLVNLTKKHLLFDDDVASVDFILGDRIRYNLEYYIDKGFYWSFGVKSRYNSFRKPVNFNFLRDGTVLNAPEGISQLDIELDDLTNQVYLQSVFREEFSFGAGLEHKYLQIESETITGDDGDNIQFDNSNYFSTYGFLRFDSFDDRYFPSRGIYFDGDFHLYFSSPDDYTGVFDEFSIAKAKLGFAFPVAKNLSFNSFAEGGFKLGNTELSSLDFVLGGYGNNFINNFIPFYGYDFLSFGGDSFVKAQAAVDWEFVKKNHVNFAANFANVQDGLFNSGEWFSKPDYTGYAIGYGLETFLGPIEAKYTWSPERGKGQWLFNVGFWF
ncbi:patatin-like phospholipase family protein [Zhouia spongiae]|uniref:Patatin-like phospholipase family protein n=1 Tax=Zhouia spongiae TaxID=2202721 RepID=A0ABY3YNP8_9FLAO|nr:patatin-like phospholipase family protein [Zhouia spongiae]UNY99457.1 patatin-like phospholipase family protein [Zhouia spongiae]